MKIGKLAALSLPMLIATTAMAQTTREAEDVDEFETTTQSPRKSLIGDRHFGRLRQFHVRI